MINFSDEKTKQRLKDFLVAVSLANLFFLTKWSEYFVLPFDYYKKMPYTWKTFTGILLNVSWLAVVFWVTKRLMMRSSNAVLHFLCRAAFLVFFLIPLNAFRTRAGLTFNEIMAHPVPVALGAVAVLFVVLRWNRPIARATAKVVLILFPFFFINVARVGWAFWHLPEQMKPDENSSLAVAYKTNASPVRVVWIILDELDQRVAFLERPPGIDLPELDRFRRECVSAENALPPGSSTMISLPALILGRSVSNAFPAGAKELTVTFRDTGESVGWSTQSNVFSRAQSAHFNTGLVGWYHPYGRLFPSALNYCQWFAYPPHDQRWGNDLVSVMKNQLLAGMPFHIRRLHRLTYEESLRHARRLVIDPKYGLVLCHLPVPHAPGIFNATSRKFTVLTFDLVAGYLGNLIVADMAFGRLRASMESSGTWNTSAVIISADHPWRESRRLDGKFDPRVPFLVKMPGDSKPLSFSPEFDTVLTHDLILAILHGDVTNHDSVAGWLEKNRSIPR